MRKKILNIAIPAILIVVFLYSVTMFAYSLYEYKKGNDIYDAAAESVAIEEHVVEKNEDSTVEEENKDVQYHVEKIASLKLDWNKFPNNVVGWIKIPGIDVINYPVVQSTDNEYYLTHLYDGTKNSNGSIFVDCRNSGFDGRHIILHGHNMKSGRMFAGIKKYKDESFANEHRYIYIGLPNGETKIFYVFAASTADARIELDPNYTAFDVSIDDEWVNETIRRSWVSSGVEIPSGVNVLTLATCVSGADEYERFVVHAVEVQNRRLVQD